MDYSEQVGLMTRIDVTRRCSPMCGDEAEEDETPGEVAPDVVVDVPLVVVDALPAVPVAAGAAVPDAPTSLG